MQLVRMPIRRTRYCTGYPEAPELDFAVGYV
jgi:hypothetical protein